MEAEERKLAAQLETACTVSDQPRTDPSVHGCAGYETVLQALREVILWPYKYKKEGAQLGIRWHKGCMLHGPPAVSYTHLTLPTILLV